jgi:hypothetical protein
LRGKKLFAARLKPFRTPAKKRAGNAVESPLAELPALF